MFSVKVGSMFSSAHYLRGYKGKCEGLHGHNWKVEVVVESEELDRLGMVLDFKYLKKKLNRLLDNLDHRCLNHLAYFKKVNPTSENISKYIYLKLKPKVKNLKSVVVWESSTSSAIYSE
ncbi:MAG: 6-carboxytetrahydropterin synthase QueD [Candidatus Omnitrophota bacterium]|nr:MAG: 6-carboxytetrahydropterin synthase QueD [Candidatus Omnitrophota bacterium]